jgi:hypothetical protein
MRTTVTLDPDVEVLIRRAVRERGEPFKQVLNNAVREGLRNNRSAQVKPFKQRTFKMGEPLVDLTKALALAGELEDLEIIAKMRQRRAIR